MDTFLTKRDRRLLGWDEILQGGLAPGATVMSWRGIQHGITRCQGRARRGHGANIAHLLRLPPGTEGEGARPSVIDLQKVYTFEPIPAELNADQARHVLGGTGPALGRVDPRREAPRFHDLAPGPARWARRSGRRRGNATSICFSSDSHPI